uniref:C-type lectin domain-containing protein n=1 Tax=Chelonoidis abingdonii TaxID=106734 RepID=A0A8C0HIQ4_CHEAB
ACPAGALRTLQGRCRKGLQGANSLLGPELDYSGFCFLDSVCGHCSWGWAWFQRTCYHFSESTKTWHEAKQFCSDYGAHLVIINTKEEQAFLVKNRTKSRVYWLGLSDKKVENQWLWVDGSPLNLSFWSTGEPNDSSDEDCGTMAIDGRWNDINCYWTDYWISHVLPEPRQSQWMALSSSGSAHHLHVGDFLSPSPWARVDPVPNGFTHVKTLLPSTPALYTWQPSFKVCSRGVG